MRVNDKLIAHPDQLSGNHISWKKVSGAQKKILMRNPWLIAFSAFRIWASYSAPQIKTFLNCSQFKISELRFQGLAKLYFVYLELDFSKFDHSEIL